MVPEVWSLPALKSLKLDHNQLTVVPEDIGNLKRLEELVCGYACCSCLQAYTYVVVVYGKNHAQMWVAFPVLALLHVCTYVCWRCLHYMLMWTMQHTRMCGWCYVGVPWSTCHVGGAYVRHDAWEDTLHMHLFDTPSLTFLSISRMFRTTSWWVSQGPWESCQVSCTCTCRTMSWRHCRRAWAGCKVSIVGEGSTIWRSMLLTPSTCLKAAWIVLFCWVKNTFMYTAKRDGNETNV